MPQLSFIVKDKIGNETEMETIGTYHDEDTSKDYIVYTDKKIDINGKFNIYYSMYKFIDNKIKLIEITSNEDRKKALEIVKELIEDSK